MTTNQNRMAAAITVSINRIDDGKLATANLACGTPSHRTALQTRRCFVMEGGLLLDTMGPCLLDAA